MRSATGSATSSATVNGCSWIRLSGCGAGSLRCAPAEFVDDSRGLFGQSVVEAIQAAVCRQRAQPGELALGELACRSDARIPHPGCIALRRQVLPDLSIAYRAQGREVRM